MAAVDHPMEASFCIAALEDALARHGNPEIFNTDQGSQFTGAAFTGALVERGITISMDGKGAWRDNVFVERLWRSVKYEEVYCEPTTASARRAASLDAISISTILHHNTHLSMWLKKRDFADRGAIPWGILDFGVRVL